MGPADMLTAEEFAAAYRAENGIPLMAWEMIGFRVVPCDCGLRDCPGWRVVLPEADRPTTRLQRLRMTPPG